MNFKKSLEKVTRHIFHPAHLMDMKPIQKNHESKNVLNFMCYVIEKYNVIIYDVMVKKCI